jgi:hypothetical protein
MSSPLLERHLGEICQHIYGVGGTRSERLSAAVADTLSTLLSKSDIQFSQSKRPASFSWLQPRRYPHPIIAPGQFNFSCRGESHN